MGRVYERAWIGMDYDMFERHLSTRKEEASFVVVSGKGRVGSS